MGMNRHLICMNGKRKPNRGLAFQRQLQGYDLLIRSSWLKRMVEEIRQGNQEVKDELPFRCPHYFGFEDDKRQQKHIVAELFTWQTCIDIDDAVMVPEAIRKAYELNESEGEWKDMLLHMDYSARKKLHIDVRMPVGLTIEETQQRYCQALGVPYDESCITPERFIYITDIGSELYRSEHWYEMLSDEDIALRRKAFTDRGLTIDGRSIDSRSVDSRTQSCTRGQQPCGKPANPEPSDGNHTMSPTPCGNPMAMKVFDLCLEKSGLSPSALQTVGTRHNALKMMMPDLGQMMQKEELLGVLAVKMPGYAAEKDCLQLVDDFYQKYIDTSRPMTLQQKSIFRESVSFGVSESKAREQDSDQTSVSVWKPTLDWKQLPIGLRESLAGNPENMHWPILCAVMPLAAAYADGVEVTYCDGKRMRLALMAIIIGEQASGKSSCKDMVEVWLRQMEAEDALARKREEEWKEKKKGRKANEKAPEDPRVMIREVPVTISCSTLLKRLKNSQGHTLYSFGEELDTLRKTNGAGSWSSKYDIYRMAFDHGKWGQDYNSDQAESGIVEVGYNFSILGTYGALRKCFKADNIENGLSSRMLLAEMPSSLFAEMPVYKERSTELDDRIDEAVTILRRAQGHIDTPRLRKAIREWVEQKRVEAAREMNRVKDVYRRRAAVIAFRCGVIHHLLSSVQTTPRESKATIDFALMMADYVLYEQMLLFGEALMSQYVSAEDEGQRYTRNHSIFDELPPVFSMAEVQNLKGSEYSPSALYMMIHRWVKLGWIQKTGKSSWQKCMTQRGSDPLCENSHNLTVSQSNNKE